MAFTRIDSWEVIPAAKQGRTGIWRPVAKHFAIISEWRLRRFVGGTFTVAVHAAAILFLLTKLGDATERRGKNSPVLTILDLGRSPTGQAASDDQSEARATTVSTPAKSDQLPAPTEWGLVKVQVARPTILEGTSDAADGRPAGAAGGGYDPYAGAAPENFDRLPQRNASTFARTHSVDGDTLANALRRKLLQIEPNLRFPLTVQLIIDAKGSIMATIIVRSAMPTDTILRLQSRLQGATLPLQTTIPAGQTRKVEVSL